MPCSAIATSVPQLLSISHETVYRYRRAVTFNEHRAIFRPRDSHDLRVIDARLTLSPPGHVRWIHDAFSNSIALITFERAAEELRFASQIEIEHYGLHEPAFPIRSYAATYPFRYDNDQVVDLLPTLQCHYPDPEGAVSAWVRQFVDPGGVDTQELLVRITRAIKAQFAYQPRAIHGTQAPTETLALGSGTCRDFALLMIEAVRSLGMAARFVTGYLYDPSIDAAGAARSEGGAEVSPDSSPDRGSSLLGTGATHAWVQVYLPGAGWVEFDPTNGLVGGAHLIRVAVARDPRQAMPLSGSYHGYASDFIDMVVDVRVSAGTRS
jgi:transglutaminase-like putative cysteine protease